MSLLGPFAISTVYAQTTGATTNTVTVTTTTKTVAKTAAQKKKIVTKKKTVHKAVKKTTPVKKAVVKPTAVKPAVSKIIVTPNEHPIAARQLPAPVATPAPAVVVVAPVAVPSSAALPPTGALMNSAYPVSGCTMKLTKVEFTDHQLPNLFGATPPDPGTHYALFTIIVRNDSAAPILWNFDKFNPVLRTTQVPNTALRAINLLTADNGKFEKQPIQPGEEKTLRFHYQVPLSAQLKTMIIDGGPGEEYVFDLSGVH